MDITLKITDKLARQLYPAAPDALKSILEESCGGKQFFSDSILDRVNSLQDVFEVMGVDPHYFYHDDDTEDESAYKEIKLVTKCLNEGWTPDWNNGGERKWFLWFYMDDPGFRLGDVSCTYTFSDVGSRLCFKDEKRARKAFQIIENSYRIFHTLNKA